MERKKIAEAEANYKKQTEYFDKNLKDARKRYEDQLFKYRTFLNHYKKQFNEEHLQEAFDRIIEFMSGKVTHVVFHEYGDMTIKTFEDALISSEERSIEYGLKLVTLFGRSEGKLDFRIDRWSDGSGGSRNLCVPFQSYEEAEKHIQEVVLSRIKESKNLVLMTSSFLKNTNLIYLKKN